MSVHVSAAVWKHSTAELGARLVMLALADYSSEDGISWPAQEDIARASRLSVASVRRVLREQEKAGEIETRKAQRGRRRINVYRVLLGTPREPDYERLPFTLTEPFTTTPHIERSSDRDDRSSSTLTTAHPAPDSAEHSSYREPSEEPPETLPAPLAPEEVPKLTKIDDRDIAFDALARACSIREGSPRERDVGVALGGPKGIRAQFYREGLATGAFGPRMGATPIFERELAEEIPRRAQAYHAAMSGATLTPTALAKWWTDLPGMAAESGLDLQGFHDHAAQAVDRARRTHG